MSSRIHICCSHQIPRFGTASIDSHTHLTAFQVNCSVFRERSDPRSISGGHNGLPQTLGENTAVARPVIAACPQVCSIQQCGNGRASGPSPIIPCIESAVCVAAVCGSSVNQQCVLQQCVWQQCDSAVCVAAGKS